MKHLLSVVISCFTFSVFAQSSPGGYIEGWDNYDNSSYQGLGEREVQWAFTGLRAIDTVPDIGIHPRVFFGPDDVAEIKNRLENTTSGQSVTAQIHAYTTLLHLGYQAGGYNHNTDYGQDADGNRYIDNAGAWDHHSYYYKLIDEDPSVWEDATIKNRHRTASHMALEAFECLMNEGEIDDDTGLSYEDRSQQLSTAMTYWASLALEDPELNSDTYNRFGGIHMALAYDIHYNGLSVGQQDTVRMALALIIPNTQRHGAELAAYASTSNWTGLNSFEIITNLAIEGEEGYNPNLTDRWMRAYHTFINYGWYPSGAGYEGLGKNYMFITTGIALAKRGFSMLGHPHVKSYATEFLPAITQPFGHGFTSYDVWGGSGHDDVTGGYKFSASDAVGLKWIFPNDPKVDLMWRNYIEKWYKNDSDGYVYQQFLCDDSYYNYLLTAAIFAEDYDESTTLNEQMNSYVEEDYIAAQRGLAIMRSGSDSLDLAVQFHCRQDMGGHTHGDKLDFTLSSHGRVWIRKTYGGSPFQPTWYHSSILVDDIAIGVGDPDGDKVRQPGTLLEWHPDSQLTKVAGDATYAYTWEWHWSPQSAANDHPWLGSNGWEGVNETWNDFQFVKGDEAFYDIPFYDYAHWHQEDKLERMIKREYNPMEKVLRTVGVFKGDHPFVLIADDIQKDNSEHNYKWLGQLARDLTIESTDINLVDEDYRADFILKEPDIEGDRRLLVRVLHNENFDGSTPPGYQDTLDYVDFFTGNPFNSNPNYVRPRLIVESNSVSPDFKILLFPHVDGDVLPITSWNNNKDTLMVTCGSEVNHIAFEQNSTGRTEFNLVGDCGLVTNNADDGKGSLREVLSCVEEGDTIRFSIGLKNQTIALTSELLIDKSFTIESDLSENITIAAADPTDIAMINTIKVSSGNQLHLIGLKVEGAHGPEGSSILNNGMLYLRDMMIKKGSGTNANSSINNTNGAVMNTFGACVID